MRARNKEFRAVLKAMLLASVIAGIQLLGLGLVLTAVGRRPVSEQAKAPRPLPVLEHEQELPALSTLGIARL